MYQNSMPLTGIEAEFRIYAYYLDLHSAGKMIEGIFHYEEAKAKVYEYQNG